MEKGRPHLPTPSSGVSPCGPQKAKQRTEGEGNSCPKKETAWFTKLPKVGNGMFCLQFVGQRTSAWTLERMPVSVSCVTNKYVKANTTGDLHRHVSLRAFPLISATAPQMLPGVSGGPANYHLHSKPKKTQMSPLRPLLAF